MAMEVILTQATQSHAMDQLAVQDQGPRRSAAHTNGAAWAFTRSGGPCTRAQVLLSYSTWHTMARARQLVDIVRVEVRIHNVWQRDEGPEHAPRSGRLVPRDTRPAADSVELRHGPQRVQIQCTCKSTAHALSPPQSLLPWGNGTTVCPAESAAARAPGVGAEHSACAHLQTGWFPGRPEPRHGPTPRA